MTFSTASCACLCIMHTKHFINSRKEALLLSVETCYKKYVSNKYIYLLQFFLHHRPYTNVQGNCFCQCMYTFATQGNYTSLKFIQKLNKMIQIGLKPNNLSIKKKKKGSSN